MNGCIVCSYLSGISLCCHMYYRPSLSMHSSNTIHKNDSYSNTMLHMGFCFYIICIYSTSRVCLGDCESGVFQSSKATRSAVNVLIIEERLDICKFMVTDR